ncbi:MAG: 50S ribosomal protein L31e [Candidatus Nitrosotenuis sp.]
MSQEAERVYTINLGKVWLSPNNQRAKRAINMIKEFATHHMKTEQIKIDQGLSQAVWKRGIRSPPRKIRVKMAKTDEGYVLVSTYEEEVKTEGKVEEKPKDKKAKKQPEPKVEPEVKPEPKVEEPKVMPEPKKEVKKSEEPKKEAKKDEKPKKDGKKVVKKLEGKKSAKKSK